MANWGTGDRGGDHDGMMRAVAEKLSMAGVRPRHDVVSRSIL
jgi:hypothetical protein